MNEYDDVGPLGITTLDIDSTHPGHYILYMVIC